MQSVFALLKKFQSTTKNEELKLWINEKLCVYLDSEFVKNCQESFPNCLLCKIFDKNFINRFDSTLTQSLDGSYDTCGKSYLILKWLTKSSFFPSSLFITLLSVYISPGHWGNFLNYLGTRNLVYKLTTYPDALDYLNIELCLGGIKIIYDLITYFRGADREVRSRIQYYFQTLPEMFASVRNSGECRILLKKFDIVF